MKGVVNFCDYFVICSGTTDRHVGGIADNIEDGLYELGIKTKLKQGVKKSDWVVFDVGDVGEVHVMFFKSNLESFMH